MSNIRGHRLRTLARGPKHVERKNTVWSRGGTMNKTIITAGIFLLPHMVFAGTDCWFNEYPDHYLAVCTGDEKARAVETQTRIANGPSVTSGTTSSRLTESSQPTTPIYTGTATLPVGAAQLASAAKSATAPQSSTATAQPAANQVTAPAQTSVPTQAAGQFQASIVNAPRPGRISKARMDAAIAARNKILQGQGR